MQKRKNTPDQSTLLKDYVSCLFTGVVYLVFSLVSLGMLAFITTRIWNTFGGSTDLALMMLVEYFLGFIFLGPLGSAFFFHYWYERSSRSKRKNSEG